ncbi:MAG: hypothetical protein KDG52_15290 [Rhodocyclaceae bacterium]|nr:hypothetical protein [Rhodocyclaceae bacterium]
MHWSYVLARRAHVLKIRRRLEQESFPRLQMGLVVTLTGVAGLLASFVMLRAGIDAMVVRYPLAVVCAYLAFLLLLWLWLRTRAADWVDAGLSANPGPGLEPRPGSPPFAGEPAQVPPWQAEGGAFGGGGASGHFGDASAVVEAGSASEDGADLSAASLSEGLGDADEFAVPFAALLLLVGMVLASFYVVWIAPVLFAELLVDGTLSYGLYRCLRRGDRHWLRSAWRRTWLPFLLTAIFAALVGMALGEIAPGTRSLGEVVQSTWAADGSAGAPRR